MSEKNDAAVCTFEVHSGEHIGDACARAAALAYDSGEAVRFSFNNFPLVAEPGMNAQEVGKPFWAEMDRRKNAADAQGAENARRLALWDEMVSALDADAAMLEGVHFHAKQSWDADVCTQIQERASAARDLLKRAKGVR